MNQRLNDNLIYVTQVVLDSKSYCIFRDKSNFSFVFFRFEDNDYKLVNIDEYNKLYSIFNKESSNIYYDEKNNNSNHSLDLISNNYYIGNSNISQYVSNLRLKSKNKLMLSINGKQEPFEFDYELIIDKRDKSKDIKFINDFITQTFKDFFEDKFNDKYSYLTKEKIQNLLNKINFQVVLTMNRDFVNVGGIYSKGENDCEKIHVFSQIVKYGNIIEMNAEKLIQINPKNFAGILTHEFTHLLSYHLCKSEYEENVGFSRDYMNSRNFSSLNEAITEIYSQKGEIFSAYKPLVDFVKKIYLPKNYGAFYMKKDLEGLVKSISRYYSVKESVIYGFYFKLDAYLSIRDSKIESSLIEKDIYNDILFLNLCKLKSINKRKLLENFDSLKPLDFVNLKGLDEKNFDLFEVKKKFIFEMVLNQLANKDEEKDKNYFLWLQQKMLNYNVNIKDIETRLKSETLINEKLLNASNTKNYYNYLETLFGAGVKDIDDFITHILMLNNNQRHYFLINLINNQEKKINRKLTEEEISKVLIYSNKRSIAMFDSMWKDLPKYSNKLYKTLNCKIDISMIISVIEKYAKYYTEDEVNEIYDKYLSNAEFSTKDSFLKLVPVDFMSLNINRAKQIFTKLLNFNNKENCYACNLFISRMIEQNGFNVNKTLEFLNVMDKEHILDAISYINPSLWKKETYLNYLIRCKQFYKNENIFEALNYKYLIEAKNNETLSFSTNAYAGFGIFNLTDFGIGKENNINYFFDYLITTNNNDAKEVGLDFLDEFSKCKSVSVEVRMFVLQELLTDVLDVAKDNSSIAKDLFEKNKQSILDLKDEYEKAIDFANNNLLYAKEENVK